jgi:hypothetical protein
VVSLFSPAVDEGTPFKTKTSCPLKQRTRAAEQAASAAFVFQGGAEPDPIQGTVRTRNWALHLPFWKMLSSLIATTMAAAPTRRSITRTALLSLVWTLAQATGLSAQDDGSGPLVATALLVPGGPAVYLGSGLVLTAAHLVNPGADLTVAIARAKLPAKVLKQGAYEGIDISLLHIDKSKLPPTLPAVQLCSAPPWPGDPVIVIDAGRATRSTIVAPGVLPSVYQHHFPTLIKDVATTGNSGSGVFDATKKCLLGVMSRKFTANGRDIAKYFVSADLIRVFMKGVELPKDNPDDQAH